MCIFRFSDYNVLGRKRNLFFCISYQSVSVNSEKPVYKGGIIANCDIEFANKYMITVQHFLTDFLEQFTVPQQNQIE